LESEKNAAFENLYQQMVQKPTDFIEYTTSYPKHEFLDFLSKTKGFMLHGSYIVGTHELEPRMANCISKKFGNLKAVYATQDAILPIFYAIGGTKRFPEFDATISAGFTDKTDRETGKTIRTYTFKADEETLRRKPWSEGVVNILSKDSFEQGTDDNGRLLDEFISRTPITPIARLKVVPEDFPYLNDIQIYTKKSQ